VSGLIKTCEQPEDDHVINDPERSILPVPPVDDRFANSQTDSENQCNEPAQLEWHNEAPWKKD
jgi:hypothetical protein